MSPVEVANIAPTPSASQSPRHRLPDILTVEQVQRVLDFIYDGGGQVIYPGNSPQCFAQRSMAPVNQYMAGPSNGFGGYPMGAGMGVGGFNGRQPVNPIPFNAINAQGMVGGYGQAGTVSSQAMGSVGMAQYPQQAGMSPTMQRLQQQLIQQPNPQLHYQAQYAQQFLGQQMPSANGSGFGASVAYQHANEMRETIEADDTDDAEDCEEVDHRKSKPRQRSVSKGSAQKRRRGDDVDDSCGNGKTPCSKSASKRQKRTTAAAAAALDANRPAYCPPPNGLSDTITRQMANFPPAAQQMGLGSPTNGAMRPLGQSQAATAAAQVHASPWSMPAMPTGIYNAPVVAAPYTPVRQTAHARAAYLSRSLSPSK